MAGNIQNLSFFFSSSNKISTYRPLVDGKLDTRRNNPADVKMAFNSVGIFMRDQFANHPQKPAEGFLEIRHRDGLRKQEHHVSQFSCPKSTCAACWCSNLQKRWPEAVKHHLQSSVICISNSKDRGASGGQSAPGGALSLCPSASRPQPLGFNQHRITAGPGRAVPPSA